MGRTTVGTTPMRIQKCAVSAASWITHMLNVCQSSYVLTYLVPLLGKFQCPPTRALRCQNDRVCLQVSKRCDGVNNCGDNSDELNCREFWASFKSLWNHLLPQLYWMQCWPVLMCTCVSTETPAAVPTCEKDEFLCANNRCISSTLRCNFFNDCEDYGSDEINCKTGASCQNWFLYIKADRSTEVSNVWIHWLDLFFVLMFRHQTKWLQEQQDSVWWWRRGPLFNQWHGLFLLLQTRLPEDRTPHLWRYTRTKHLTCHDWLAWMFTLWRRGAGL